MSKPEEDIISVLSNYVKGKAGPPGASIAKLSWDGSSPPQLPNFPTQSRTFQEFAAEYPILISGLSRCDRATCLAIIGAMLTLPELQSNCYRLEVLAHLAVHFAAGKAKPTGAQISAWFNQLDQGTCGRQEDAAEDIFTSSVHYEGANYRLFEGTAEGNAFYTQLFLDVLQGMPNEGGFKSLKNSIEAILKLSDAIAQRANLPRNIAGNPIPRSGIAKPSSIEFVVFRSLVCRRL